MSKLTAEYDGVRYINIYSNGKTSLGRALSNFAHSPFIHPEYGEFESMEGFYFYVSTGLVNESLRKGNGYKLKQFAQAFARVPLDNFIDVVDSGCRAKVRCNGYLIEMLRESTLPFEHFYSWFDKVKQMEVVNVPTKHQWLVTTYTDIREEIKQGVFR